MMLMLSLFLVDIVKIFPPAAKFTDIGSLVNLLIPNLIIAAGVILLGMIILSGFSILKAGGNAEELKKTQKLLTYSVVGFVIIIVSYIVVKLLGVILNTPLL